MSCDHNEMNFDFDIVVKKYLRSNQHLNCQRKLHWNILIALVIDYHGIMRINDNHDDNNFVVWINDKKMSLRDWTKIAIKQNQFWNWCFFVCSSFACSRKTILDLSDTKYFRWLFFFSQMLLAILNMYSQGSTYFLCYK